jgi:hypothetical protein
LADSLDSKALRTSEYVKAGPIVPPHFRVRASLGAERVIVELAHKDHRPPAALRYLFVLNPNSNSESPSVVTRRLSQHFNDGPIVLSLTIHKLKFFKPIDIWR